MTPATLYRNGRLYSPADPRATALLVRDGRIAWLGVDADAPVDDAVVDLAGALVTPAFVDAHVHTTATGVALRGLELGGCRSASDVLDAVAAFATALPADAVVIGHGWDESTWASPVPPDAGALDRAAAGRRVYLSQKSVHSALASGPLLAAVPDLAGVTGFNPSGWLRLDAHHRVREIALGSITAAQRREAQRGALRAAAALGIAAVHECGGPAGFQAIGDAAIANVLAGYAAAAARVGLDRLRAGRHRVEHLEILDRDLIRALVEHNVTASLQPAFDRLWGGDGKMYAHRLGVERAMASNPIAALAGVGGALACGSDSPVTPLDPWGSVRAAVAHHNPASRI